MNSRMKTLVATATFTLASFGSLYGLDTQPASLGRPLSKHAVLSELMTKVDSKKSQPGEAVSARTLNPLNLDDGTVLPKGTVLLGRVTQAHAKSSGGAMVSMVFDQVERKGADPMPVHGLIVAVAAAPNLSDGGASTNDLPLGSGGDSKGAIAAMTGTSIGNSDYLLPPIQPGSAIKGLFLNPVPAADGSSVLQASDKEIRLEKGTRLEIGLLASR